MTINIISGADAGYALVSASSDSRLGDFDEDQLIAVFKEHGAILLRGFKPDLEEFKSITETLCVGSVFNESPGRQIIDAPGNIQTVNLGTEAFPLHPELSRDPWRPDACFFWCVSAPQQGGETLICDGVEIVARMPSEVFDAFKERRLVYAQRASANEMQYWLETHTPDDELLEHPPASCPYRFFRAGGDVIKYFSRPALHRPMFSDQLAFGNFLLFARYLLDVRSFPVFDDRTIVPDHLVAAVKTISDEISIAVPWQTGDLLILDNSRFMHGRNPVVDVRDRLIAAYFGYLRFAPENPEEPPDAIWRQAGFRTPKLNIGT